MIETLQTGFWIVFWTPIALAGLVLWVLLCFTLLGGAMTLWEGVSDLWEERKTERERKKNDG